MTDVTDTAQPSTDQMTMVIAAGIGVAGLVLGFVFGALVTVILTLTAMRKKQKKAVGGLMVSPCEMCNIMHTLSQEQGTQS